MVSTPCVQKKNDLFLAGVFGVFSDPPGTPQNDPKTVVLDPRGVKKGQNDPLGPPQKPGLGK